MLGLSRKEARERFDDIIAFAELEEFVDLKLKNYSSGMHVRLAFATAIQVDADILLIDEVLAVGDAAFQQKCFDEFTRLQRAGTHDPVRHARHGRRSSASATARCCSTAGAWSTSAIRRRSRASTTSSTSHRVRQAAACRTPAPEAPHAPPVAEVLNAWFESPRRRARDHRRRRASPATCGWTSASSPTSRTRSSRSRLQSESGHYVVRREHATAQQDRDRTVRGRARRRRSGSAFENWLAPGRYRLFATVARAGLGADVFDAHVSSSIIVLADRPGGGMADLPHTVRDRRGDSAAR